VRPCQCCNPIYAVYIRNMLVAAQRFTPTRTSHFSLLTGQHILVDGRHSADRLGERLHTQGRQHAGHARRVDPSGAAHLEPGLFCYRGPTGAAARHRSSIQRRQAGSKRQVRSCLGCRAEARPRAQPHGGLLHAAEPSSARCPRPSHRLASPSKLPRAACTVHCRTPEGQAEVLCMGDSLTAGSASADWVAALAAAAPGWAAVNAGTNSQVRALDCKS